MNSVMLRNVSDEGGRRELTAQITKDGNLLIEGYDCGRSTKGILGDSDYEYTHTIPSSHLNQFLLLLLQNRFDPEGVPFTRSGEISDLCNKHGIPCKFWSWA